MESLGRRLIAECFPLHFVQDKDRAFGGSSHSLLILLLAHVLSDVDAGVAPSVRIWVSVPVACVRDVQTQHPPDLHEGISDEQRHPVQHHRRVSSACALRNTTRVRVYRSRHKLVCE